MSMLRSYLNDASVLSPCLFAVFLIVFGSKYALSIKTSLVYSLTPVLNPPKTPAKHIGLFPSQITKSSLSNSLSIPSSVINFVFDFNF